MRQRAANFIIVLINLPNYCITPHWGFRLWNVAWILRRRSFCTWSAIRRPCKII